MSLPAAYDRYTYTVVWSDQDREYVATCAEFPSLSWLDVLRVEALLGIVKLVRETITEMRASGEVPPPPKGITR